MATVFISHAGVDTDSARRVQGWLDGAGHRARLDRSPGDGIGLGEEWRRQLGSWLRGSDAMVCVVTSAYLSSPWCSYEIGAARTRGCEVLPLRSEPGLTHPLLADLHHADLHDADAAREAVLEALRRIDGAAGVGWDDDRSPFPGLAPFDRSLSRVFCGRDGDVTRLVNDLRRVATECAGLLPVIGPSGCGKSSLVRAGLVPRMADDPAWVVLDPFTPRRDPVGQLARALARTRLTYRPGSHTDVGELRERLGREGLPGIAEELLDVAGPAAGRLLVVVDQFEELYGPVDPEPFLALLRSAAAGPVQVVATLRSEDLDLLLAEPGLALATPWAVRTMGRAALRAVVEEPAARAGITVRADLVDTMIDDTGGGDALPLLAYTLSELAVGVERGGELSAARYAQLGGVHGALRRQADAALRAATTATGLGDDAVLDGLLRLVTVDAQRLPTRARVDVADLPPEVEDALRQFVERRLLITEDDDGVVSLTIAHEKFLTEWAPLAEAIDRVAPALSTRDRADEMAAEWVRAGWPPDWGRLWTGDELGAALGTLRVSLLRRPGVLGGPIDLTSGLVTLGNATRQFLLAGARRDSRVRRRSTTVLSLLLVIALLAAGVTTALWRTTRDEQRATTVRGLLAQADTMRSFDPATALRLELAAETLRPDAATRAALAAGLTASRFAGTLPDAPATLGEAAFTADGRTMALRGGDNALTLWDLTHGPPTRLAALPDTAATPSELRVVSGHGPDPTLAGVAFTPDGHTLVTENGTADLVLWDVHDPVAPRPLGPPLLTHDPHGETPLYDALVAITPDGRTLAVARGPVAPGTVALLDVTDPATAHRVGTAVVPGGTAVDRLAFAGSGEALLAGTTRPPAGGFGRADDGQLVTWDVTDRTAPRSTGQGIPYAHMAYAPARNLMAVDSFAAEARTVPTPVAAAPAEHPRPGAWISTSGTTTPAPPTSVTLWDLAQPLAPRVAAALGSTRGAGVRVDLAPDGSRLAVTADRSTAGSTGDGEAPDKVLAGGDLGIWDVTDPGHPRALVRNPVRLAGTGSPRAVTFLPGRPAVAIEDSDVALSVFDYAGGDLDPVAPVLDPHLTGVVAAVLPDGHAALGFDGRLWDLTDRRMPRRIAVFRPGQQAMGLAFVDGPRDLAVAEVDGAVDRLALPLGEGPPAVRRLVPASGHSDSDRRLLALSPHRGLLASADAGGAVTLVDLHDPTHGWSYAGPFLPVAVAGQKVTDVSFTADNSLWVTAAPAAGPAMTSRWDVGDLTVLHRYGALGPRGMPVVGVSRDGTLAARPTSDLHGVELLDLTGPDTPRRIGEPIGLDQKRDLPVVGLAPDGHLLAAASQPGHVVLWDLSDPAAPRELPALLTVTGGDALGLAFSPDGRTLAMTTTMPDDDSLRPPQGYFRLGGRRVELQLWDVSDPTQPRRLTSGVTAAGARGDGILFSDDGSTLAVRSGTGAVEVVDVTGFTALRADPRPMACTAAGGGLTRAEWTRYVGDESYVDTCPA